MAFQPLQGPAGPASTGVPEGPPAGGVQAGPAPAGGVPAGPAPAGSVPAARLSVTRDGDALTATAAVPFSLQAVMAKGFGVLLPLYFVSFAWRGFASLGGDSAGRLVPTVLLLVFGGFAALTSGWGLAMAVAGRVTVTFDRSRIGVLQETFGRMRRAKDYSVAGITGLGVTTGRISKAAQQARFDGLFGQSKPASYLGFRYPLGAVALFPGMPESDLLTLLGQIRSHYSMLGVDIAMAEEQPGEVIGTVATPDRAAQLAPATGDPARGGFWNEKSTRMGEPASTPPISDQPNYDPEEPPR